MQDYESHFINRAYELIYLLDEQYYIIGGNTCRICEDDELIAMYQELFRLANTEEFQEVYMHHSADQEYPHIVLRAGELCKAIKDKCFISIQESTISPEEKNIRDQIIRDYSNEINRQHDTYLRVEWCYDRRSCRES